MINKIQILKRQLKNDWVVLSLVSKCLVIIGGLILLIIIYFTVTDVDPSPISNDIKVMFRSSLVLIFGFILSSNIKNNNKENMTRNYLLKKDNNEDENNEICKKRRYCNYENGNTVQIFIAFIITVVSVIMILIMYTKGITSDISILAQFRDLMCISIGFLFGESRIKLE